LTCIFTLSKLAARKKQFALIARPFVAGVSAEKSHIEPDPVVLVTRAYRKLVAGEADWLVRAGLVPVLPPQTQLLGGLPVSISGLSKARNSSHIPPTTSFGVLESYPHSL